MTALQRFGDWLIGQIARIPPDWRRHLGNLALVLSGLMLVWMVLALAFGWHTSPWYALRNVSRLRFVLYTVCFSLFWSVMFLYTGLVWRRWAIKLPARSGASSESDARSGLGPGDDAK